MEDYDTELSECNVNEDCEIKYSFGRDYPDHIIVNGHADDRYNGLYEPAE